MPQFRRVTSLLLAAVALALGGCASSSVSTKSGAMPMSAPGFLVRWQVSIPLVKSDNEGVRHVWHVGSNVYVATTVNRLYCVDASSGVLKWMVPFANPNLAIFCPQDMNVGGVQTVVVFTRTTVRSLDPDNGDIKLMRRLRFAAGTDPLVDGNVICIGGAESYFRGVYEDYLGQTKWTVWSRNDGFSAPAIDAGGGNIVFGSLNGYVWLTSARTAGNGWQRRTGGAITAAPAVDKTNAYIASGDNKLYAFDLQSSSLNWSAFIEGTLDQTPVPIGHTIAIVSSGNGAFGYSADKGDKKWSLPGVVSIASHTADHLYAIDGSNNLLSVDSESGTVDGKFPLGKQLASAINAVDSTVYTIRADGLLIAIQPQK
jgi:outer membrane protein assembly factor BamB